MGEILRKRMDAAGEGESGVEGEKWGVDGRKGGGVVRAESKCAGRREGD